MLTPGSRKSSWQIPIVMVGGVEPNGSSSMGSTRCLCMRREAHPDVPLTVYYAYKQQDIRDSGKTSNWLAHTLLDGLIDAGWEITATWPMRTETSSRMIASGANALASSIVLACRPRPADASAATRRAFVSALKAELPEALRNLFRDHPPCGPRPGGDWPRHLRLLDTRGYEKRMDRI